MRIEICGGIASGKTTLCTNISRYGIIPVFEKFQDNPFWVDFNNDHAAYAFETEITFLFQHYHDIKKQNSISENFVCDFSMFQDLAYAENNLNEKQKELFFLSASILMNEIQYPFLLIHLVCPEEVAIERIKMRDRESEKTISIEYLKQINSCIFSKVNSLIDKVNVLVIDSSLIDLRSSLPSKLEQILSEKFYIK